MNLRLSPLFFALASLAIGCGGSDIGTGNHCTSNADCTGGSSCDTIRQLCVAPNGSF